MVRPKRYRFIGKTPEIDYFKPKGIPLNQLEEVRLTVSEYEALRLNEIENLDQKKCAELMNVSQPTFSRVLDSARKKLADAVINAKAIRIGGGIFKQVERVLICSGCNDKINVESEKNISNNCPKCGNENFQRRNKKFSTEHHRGMHGKGRHRRNNLMR